jgi:hypothetical protein
MKTQIRAIVTHLHPPPKVLTMSRLSPANRSLRRTYLSSYVKSSRQRLSRCSLLLSAKTFARLRQVSISEGRFVINIIADDLGFGFKSRIFSVSFFSVLGAHAHINR